VTNIDVAVLVYINADLQDMIATFPNSMLDGARLTIRIIVFDPTFDA